LRFRAHARVAPLVSLRSMAAVPGPGSIQTPVDRHPSPSAPRSRTLRSRPADPDVLVRGICPYLETDEGWRSVVADRAHRCVAVAPGVRLAARKQRRLCLVEAHASCPTYVAATAITTDGLGGAAIAGARILSGQVGSSVPDVNRGVAPRRWPVARTHLTVLDPGRRSTRLAPLAPARAIAQVAVLVIALLAFAGLVIAGSFSTDAAVARRESTSEVAPSLDWTAINLGTPEPSAAATPTLRPTPDHSSTAPRRYTIRSGDTLAAIAARFGTTVKALRAANHVDPSHLRIGRELVVP